MTDLHTENARLRAALEAIYEITVEPAETDHKNVRGWIEVTARNAIATPAPDAVQEAARDTDLLLDAYKGLLVLHRLFDKIGLQAGAKTTSDLADRIVAAHPEFPGRAALRNLAGDRT